MDATEDTVRTREAELAGRGVTDPAADREERDRAGAATERSLADALRVVSRRFPGTKKKKRRLVDVFTTFCRDLSWVPGGVPLNMFLLGNKYTANTSSLYRTVLRPLLQPLLPAAHDVDE